MPRAQRVPEFATANQIKERYGVAEAKLLRIVSSGLVRFEARPGFLPVYSVADVQNHLAAHPPRRRMRAPTAP